MSDASHQAINKTTKHLLCWSVRSKRLRTELCLSHLDALLAAISSGVLVLTVLALTQGVSLS